MIAPLPYLNEFEFSTTYPDFDDTVNSNLNEYLLLFQVSRIFMLSRLLLLFSPFMNSRAQRVCKMNGHDDSYMFAIRSLMQS